MLYISNTEDKQLCRHRRTDTQHSETEMMQANSNQSWCSVHRCFVLYICVGDSSWRCEEIVKMLEMRL